MNFLILWLKGRRWAAAAFFICCGVFAAAFALYHLPLEAVAYPAALCLGLLLCFAAADLWRQKNKYDLLCRLRALPENLREELEGYHGLDDEGYRAVIEALVRREQGRREHMNAAMADMLDYYTTWVHQVKTPIASMGLTLQNEDSPLSRKVSEDLLRIEQYVDMVLTYLRLDSEDSDYVFRRCSVDKIVKSALRKFAGQFIRKGLRLDYRGTDEWVLTDEKWLAFVLEQVLSNALKYTARGSISIYMEGTVLCVGDTGIGISPEDLPRIFQRGYTGCNGRAEQRASGLGLWLCSRICGDLGHTITAESEVGRGTTIMIDLSSRETRYD